MGTASIGVGAHITAAAPGGKRYDTTLTNEERKGFDNGIWLCQTCAKLIDSDELKFNIQLLRTWKIEAENNASQSLESGIGFSSPQLDRTLLVQATLLGQLGELLSGETDKAVEAMRNTWREGNKENAIVQLKSLKSNQNRWNILSNQLKAKILRFEAGLFLDSENGLLNAKNLADQAYQLDPSDNNQSKIRALISRQEGSVNDAINYLKTTSDIDGLNMLAALHLENGDNAGCQQVLDGIDTSTANAETYRLRALLDLFNKNIEQARLNIYRAEQLSPAWYIVRLNRGMIDFFSAVSNAVLPDRPILWPEPISPDMVKHDKESIAHLQNATRIFEELAKYENPGIDAEIVSNWKIACQLINFAKQDETNGLIQAHLKSKPSDYYLIVCALALNYEFDMATSETAIVTLLNSGKGTMFHVIALCGLLVKRATPAEAEKALNKHQDLFNLHHAESIWQFWMVQALGLQGKKDEANELINQMQLNQDLRYARGLILSLEAQKTESDTVIIDYLEQQFVETSDPLFLLQACKIKFSQQDWKYIADRATILVDAYQTADILWLAMVAAFNSQDFNLCMQLLEQNQYMFGQELPADVRRLKATCLREQGSLKAAIAEMEALPRHSTQGLYQTATMYLQQGDLKKFSLVSRQLAEKSDLGPAEALQLAHYLRQEDPELARKFFKKAEAENLPAKFLGHLLSTALNLGLDNETGPLQQKISQSNSNETGLKLVSFEELQDLITKSAAEALRTESIYGQGNIPVHLFAHNQNINLIEFYHIFLDFNEKETNVFSKTLMFVRHGGKAITDFNKNLDEIDLHLDITSILLAEHLGILGAVERAFKVINIPDKLIVSLVEMRDQLLPHQPSQISAADSVISLVAQGKIQVLESDTVPLALDTEVEVQQQSLIQYTRDRNGKILRSTTSVESISNSEVDSAYVNPRSLIDVLLRRGKISVDKHLELIELLGTEGKNNENDSDLEIGMAVYCFRGSLSLLTNGNCLELICNNFDVYIEPEYLNRNKEEIQTYKIREQSAKWLFTLIERLRQGIDSEKYKFIVIPRGSDVGEWKFDPFNNLKALFAFPKTDSAVIWSDDRHLNSFSNRDGIPIVAMNEILNALLSSETIDQKTYFSVLSQMRAANLLFIPLNGEEICYYLLKAPLDGSGIQDTNELKILKSYAMRALGLANYLQKPGSDQPNQQGEISFLFQYVHASEDAIVEIWESNNLSVEHKRIYSSWILDNLFVDYAALANIIGIQQTKEHQEHLEALKLMGLLGRGLSLPGKKKGHQKGHQSVRNSYFTWLNDRLIEIEINFNAEVFKRSLTLLKQIIIENRAENIEEIPLDFLDLIFQDFCSDLPETIRDILEEDHVFMATIGVNFLITIENYQFELDDFWNSMTKVAEAGKIQITPTNFDHEISITFETTRNQSGVLSIVDPHAEIPLFFEVPEFLLLSHNRDQQVSFLKKKSELFDCSEQELRKIIDQILSESTPRKKVERFVKLQEMNLDNHYSRLFEHIRKRQNLIISELLPPTASAITQYYHINKNIQKTFLNIMKDSAASLLKRHSIAGAFRRLSSIPVALPIAVYNRFHKIDKERQKKQLKTLLQDFQSPISMMHLTKFLLQTGDKNPAYRRLGLQKLKYMLTAEYEMEVKAFISVLNWTSQYMRTEEETPKAIKLTTMWTHAHKLYSILKTTGAPPTWIQDFFSKNIPMPRAVFESDREIRYDATFPGNITPQAMIVCGIAYCADDQTDEIDNDFQRGLANICVFRAGDHIIPNPMLMDDITTLTDYLQSIFSGDRGKKLSDLLGAELSGVLSSPNLNYFLESVVANLESRKLELAAWMELYSTTRGICLPEAIKESLVTLLSKMDFNELFQKDIALGHFAFHVTSIIALTTNSNTLATHIIEQSRVTATKFSLLYPAKTAQYLDGEDQMKVLDAIKILLEATFNISKMKNTPEERVIAFSELIREIAKCWDYLAIRSRPIVQVLCEILPIEQAKHVWRLLIYLRTIE